MSEELSSKRPKLNKKEIMRLFWVLLIVDNFLAFIVFAREFSAIRLHYTVGELAAFFAYIFASVPLESLITLALLLGFSFLLPFGWFRERLAFWGLFWFFMLTIYLLPFIGFLSGQGLTTLYMPISQLDSQTRLAFIGGWTLVMGVISVLLRGMLNKPLHYDRFEKFYNRLEVLAYIYLVMDVVSIFIILVRTIYLAVT